MYSKSLLVTLMVFLRVCTSQLGWGPQTDPLSLWRFYSSAGFLPDESLWDERETYIYVHAAPLDIFSRIKKGDRRSARSHRNTLIAERFSRLEARAKSEYMTQLYQILRDYYDVIDPKPFLQTIHELSPSWNYLGYPELIELSEKYLRPKLCKKCINP